MAKDGDAVERILREGGGGGGGDTGEALARLVELVRSEREALREYEVSASEAVALVRDGMRCVDVRSPGEYARGHIPGAVNVPLFSDAERAAVGTCYKLSGREAAMALGMSKVWAKGLDSLASAAKGEATSVCLHCWRGGLRSGAVAWLLRRRGVRVYCLVGGYKRFRAWVRGLFGSSDEARNERKLQADDDRLDAAFDDGTIPADDASTMPGWPRLVVVAGRTGVGKTRVLHALRDAGQQVLDLEGLARHRGSAFGFVEEQPKTEAFENALAFEWIAFDASKPVFVEDEDLHVGTCSVPRGLFDAMQTTPYVVRLLASVDTRVAILLSDYALVVDNSHQDEDENPAFADRLRADTRKVAKRLGAEHTARALHLIETREYPALARLLLVAYYDKLYDAHLARKANASAPVDVEVVVSRDAYDAAATAHTLLDKLNLP